MEQTTSAALDPVVAARVKTIQSLAKLLDRSPWSWCILHPWRGYPSNVEADSDIDILLPPEALPHEFGLFLDENTHILESSLIQYKKIPATASHLYVLAIDDRLDDSSTLSLDVSSDHRRLGVSFYSADELLHGRRRVDGFWLLEPALEFGYCLTKWICGSGILGDRQSRLSSLYLEYPAECDQQLNRFWGAKSVRILSKALKANNWLPVQEALPRLRRELLSRRVWRSPAVCGMVAFERARDALRRPLLGLWIGFLGTDGVGKSTMVQRFRNNSIRGFGKSPNTRHWFLRIPGNRRLYGRVWLPLQSRLYEPWNAGTPHSRPVFSVRRSWMLALLWYGHAWIDYLTNIRVQTLRSRIFVSDRIKLPDAMVDPIRYRYGGSRTLLSSLWKRAAKPDIIFVLDAEPDVIYSRKQELTRQETERQRKGYRDLTKELSNSYIVDTSKPVSEVERDIHRILINIMNERTVKALKARRPTGI